MIVNIWRYRAFIVRNAVSDLRYRYAGSALGIVWHVVNPLAQILIYTVVFSQLMTVRVPGLSGQAGFALYVCAGLLPWVGFSECVLRGAGAFVENAAYLKKLPIPEQVFVAQTAVSASLSLAISMTLLLLVALVTGAPAWPSWAAVPLVLILLQGFGFGLGLFFGTLNAFIRDVGQMLVIGLSFWMWATPIVYVVDILPASLRGLVRFNPAYPFVDALHRAVLAGEWPDGAHWLGMAAWTLAAAGASYGVLLRLRPEIRDVL